MRKLVSFLVFAFIALFSCRTRQVDRPKIVVGIVIDQMRWDYLYRYNSRFGNDGFRRLLKDGFECRNTFINYLPSYTGPGHACIYTGSVPSMNGIAGNEWTDNVTGIDHYCVDDSTVKITGDHQDGTSMSPANLLTTTITDELRLATNFKSRVYGVALKDRASILPAGHLANAAYWYNDKTGNFVSSTYYKNPTPNWLAEFNRRREGDELVKQGWDLLYDKESYTQSTADDNSYEGAFDWEAKPVFPRRFDTLSVRTRNGLIKSIPAGNTFSIKMAKACIEGEQLGRGDETDFITLSLSSTDYVGHRFGPNSIEMEDTYLRLDRDIADFLKYLDHRFGRNHYLVFLTADHGGAHNPHFLTDNKVPAGLQTEATTAKLNASAREVFGVDSLVMVNENYQVSLNESAVSKATFDRETIRASIVEWLRNMDGISYVIDMEHLDRTPVPEPIRTMAVNGYNRNRSGSILIIPSPGWFDNGGKPTGTTHGTWNPYDTHIPLLWYGWHIQKGNTSEKVYMTDIAPTLADLLSIQMPNGCIGASKLNLMKK
ncbi:MAG: alkaline phosphatase family protein [Taibaiella sp.]|nr:alkaline phosphatase family protein [Taibaiella sp.]